MFRLISGPKEGWLYLLLLMAVVLSPALSLADAAWVDELWIVPWMAGLSVLLGAALARQRVRALVAHLFAIEVGLVLVATYFASLVPEGNWGERLASVGERVVVWVGIAIGGGMSNDNMLFAMFAALGAWLLGYFSAWQAFRMHVVWPTLVASGSALLINLSYSAPDPLFYFLLFLLASLLLLIRVTLHEKERDWHSIDAEYNRKLTRNFLWGGAGLSVGILAFAWAMPAGTVNASVADGWYQITGPWQGLQTEFDRLFASLGSSTSRVEGNRFAKTLALKGAIELGAEPVMVVSSPRAEYWAAQSYDRYTGQGWISTADQGIRLEANDQRLAATSFYRGRQDIEQRFKLLAGRTTSVFAATSPVILSLPVYADHFESLEQLSAIRSTIPMRAGHQYAVVSSVSTASAAQLRKAGTDYPAWTARYLELPERGLRRVIFLARRLARDAPTPYDAALAIEEYLRGFQYEIKVTPPPPDRDAVDWFLFTTQEGYCDYFASSMAVMARALGIPSRVVSGYNTGTLNWETGLYEVRQENAHSWPELFFPEYGWVRFEPTPSQPAPARPETGPEEVSAIAGQLSESDLGALDLDVPDRAGLLLYDDFDLSGDRSGGGDVAGAASGKSMAISMAFLVGVLVSWVALRRMLSRLSAAGRAYLQMYWVAGLLGWGLRPSQTPREYARVLIDASPESRSEVETVVGAYVEEMYGGRRRADEKSAQQSWQRLRLRLPLRLLRRKLFR